MAIKQFIFDLDGTLWDTSTVSADAYNHALRKDRRCDLVVTITMFMICSASAEHIFLRHFLCEILNG